MRSFKDLQQQSKSEWEGFCRPDRPRVLIGSATCGRAAGSLEVLKAFETELDKHGLKADTTLVEVGCLGMCYAEVLVEIRGRDGKRVLYHGVDPRFVPRLVESHLVRGEPLVTRALAVMDGTSLDGVPSFDQMPMIRNQVRIVLRNCGVIDPANLHHYIARGGYTGLTRALQMSREEVIEEVKASGVRGRGGAGFPTGLKWQFARKSPGDVKYVICNADEGDPGAFMDRSVLEGDPHAVLEGLAISGYAIGASTGYVYCRAEYPLAVQRIQGAIAQMRENGLLGKNILGSDFSFDIQLKKGAGAFVCGEETALMQSIEGRRGMPRSRPPYPAVAGLFGKPTNINNVETLAAVSAILEKGSAWYAGYGTEKSRGTKTFALAGKINRTGLIEVPMGIPLRSVIEEIGGGVLAGKKFKAVQTGGPSGGCIPAEHIDIPVDYEHLAEVGSIMGSGGMIVIDEGACMVEVARYFLTFTENESCGKCVPCRMGPQHLLRMLTDITEGRGTPQQIETMKKISDTMGKGSLCGLGQTAPNPVLTTLRYFEDEYRAHIEEKKCPAGVCREIIRFSIDAEACTGCRACIPACPVEAITGELKKLHEINQELCIHCGSCRDVCKFDAVAVE
jgi:NADH:ubiquinone oxidoreductase subunit F (NADH-binding)/(2Fe-2S) ferredoxin